jgi:hypothetical protein
MLGFRLAREEEPGWGDEGAKAAPAAKLTEPEQFRFLGRAPRREIKAATAWRLAARAAVLTQ